MALTDLRIPVYGNVTKDPEVRVLDNGKSVVNFSIANTPRYFDPKTNTWKDKETLFINCTAFGDLAQHIGQTLTQGMRVLAIGTYGSRSWGEGDNKRSTEELVIEDIGPSLMFATATVERGGSRRESYSAPQQNTQSGSTNPFE